MSKPKETKCWVLVDPCGGSNPGMAAYTRKEIVDMVVKEFFGVDPKDKTMRRKKWQLATHSYGYEIKRARIVLEEE